MASDPRTEMRKLYRRRGRLITKKHFCPKPGLTRDEAK